MPETTIANFRNGVLSTWLHGFISCELLWQNSAANPYCEVRISESDDHSFNNNRDGFDHPQTQRDYIAEARVVMPQQHPYASIFGWVAIGAALLNLVRPSFLLCAVILIAGGFGIVLYNVALSALAVAMLILSLARSAPEPD